MNRDARIASIALHMKFSTCFRTLPALALTLAGSMATARAAEMASATISATQLNSTTWQYDLVLDNIGTTNLGTFWFSWVPGEDFMPTAPTNITSPASWTSSVTGGGYYDGSAIQWVAGSGAALTPGQTLKGFSFQSTTSPATMAGTSPYYGSPILTSFVYGGAPLSDGGFQFLAQQVSAPPPPPTVSINANGIVPIYSKSTTIQAGSWVSIYGANLAATNTTWGGDFPTKLDGTTVTINNKLAYLWYVSPGQINLQAPDDTATGTVPVVVTTSSGSVSSTVTLGQFGPSFSLLDSTHVAGIILRPDGSGTYGQGSGSYDIIGPTGNSLGYATVAAKAGDTIELFGVGFGETNPPVAAGQALSSSAQAVSQIGIMIGGTVVTPSFAGMTEAGLFQFNLTLPAGLGTGDLALVGLVGGVQTPTGVVISLGTPSVAPVTPPGYYGLGDRGSR
jgi:uncharacterized protein (TIGR03437 family)